MKLSKHPVGTIIHIELHGRFEKVPSGLWRSMDDKHTFLTSKFVNKIRKESPNTIQILAAPWRVVVELLSMLQEEYGNFDSEGEPITFDSVYKDAIVRDEESKRIQEEQQKAYVDYCKADVEVSQRLVSRLSGSGPSVIYKTQKVDMSS